MRVQCELEIDIDEDQVTEKVAENVDTDDIAEQVAEKWLERNDVDEDDVAEKVADNVDTDDIIDKVVNRMAEDIDVLDATAQAADKAARLVVDGTDEALANVIRREVRAALKDLLLRLLSDEGEAVLRGRQADGDSVLDDGRRWGDEKQVTQ
jgi:hypothetical protein